MVPLGLGLEGGPPSPINPPSATLAPSPPDRSTLSRLPAWARERSWIVPVGRSIHPHPQPEPEKAAQE